MMKKVLKQRRIILLMIITQLILTTFVVYWLRTQYISSRQRLEKELSVIFYNTQDQMIDTLLFRSYVNPLLSGKKIIKVNISQDQDSLITRSDSLQVTSNTEDIILRSVRMIVSHAGDSSPKFKTHFSPESLKIDSAQFSRAFILKMNEEGMKFGFTWNEVPGDSLSTEPRRVIMMEPLPGLKLPGAEISGVNGYLIMAVLPQLIFGVFLILLSALAFILSYRSIRDHAVLNDLRNEFIGNMTHELKTPVATLRVALEAIEKYNLSNEPVLLEEYLRLASLETARLEELINRVLDQSLLEHDGARATMIETEINSLASDAVDLMRIRLNEGSITLHRSDTDIMVVCDRLYIKGVLMNLIDNSIKYCDRIPEVTLSVRKEGGYVLIEVRDNGPGIPEEYHEKIFEKFFRLPTGNIHNVKGYGLGLSFALLVIRLHGGRIEIHNQEQGCSFVIFLPSA